MTAPAFDGVGPAEAQALLTTGRLRPREQLTEASNQTWLATVEPAEADGEAAPRIRCVYKPISGERPLWDFPTGTLADREVAAYQVSEALGWRLVPPTVMRDGPFGPGMCQLWVEVDPAFDTIALAARTDHPQLRRMALFDAVINNSDRKIGHLLPAAVDGWLYGCDHGVSFAERYKLRTVLWQWRGRPFAESDRAALGRLLETLRDADTPLRRDLAERLTAAERHALTERAAILWEHGRYPYPAPDWPAVPWPPV